MKLANDNYRLSELAASNFIDAVYLESMLDLAYDELNNWFIINGGKNVSK